MEREQSSVKRNLAKLGLGVLAYGAGALGSLAMRGKGRPEGRWFRKLDKPAFQPPNWLFGPVWTALYGAIAYSGYRVWRAPRSPERTRALALWGTQLVLNAAWTPLFFGARKPSWAFGDIAALDAATAAYAVEARKVDPIAGASILPYLAWIAYATALNGSIASNNR